MKANDWREDETFAEAAQRLCKALDARKKVPGRLQAPERFQNTRKPQWVGEGQVAGLSLVIRYLPDRPVAPEAELPMRIRVAANCNRRIRIAR